MFSNPDHEADGVIRVASDHFARFLDRSTGDCVSVKDERNA